jgi:hypothetical protein
LLGFGRISLLFIEKINMKEKKISRYLLKNEMTVDHIDVFVGLDNELHKVVALVYGQNDYLIKKVMNLDVLFVHDMVLMDDRHMVRYNQVNEVDHTVEVEKVDDRVVQDFHSKELFEVF